MTATAQPDAFTRSRLRVLTAAWRYRQDCIAQQQQQEQDRVVRDAVLEHADQQISRCPRCGAWQLDRCATPFCAPLAHTLPGAAA